MSSSYGRSQYGVAFGGVAYWMARCSRWCSRIIHHPNETSEESAAHIAEAGALFDTTTALCAIVQSIEVIARDGDGALLAEEHEISAITIHCQFVRAELAALAEEMEKAACAALRVDAATGDPVPSEAAELCLACADGVQGCLDHYQHLYHQITVCRECGVPASAWEPPGYCGRCEKKTARLMSSPSYDVPSATN